MKADERADVVKPIPKVETDKKEMTRTSSIVGEESTVLLRRENRENQKR